MAINDLLSSINGDIKDIIKPLQLIRRYTAASPSLFFRLHRIMEEIEKLCLCCIPIKFSGEKVIR